MSGAAANLPGDILLPIWKEAGLDPMILSSTCHHWRCVSHDATSLWTHILIDDDRASTSLRRAQYYIQRITPDRRRLHVTRNGAEKGVDESDLRLLDTFALGVIGLCVSFEYVGMFTEGDYGSARKEFIISLLLKESELLETLHLSTSIDYPVEVPPTIRLTPYFPRLKKLLLVDVCLPLSTMGITVGLQEFEFSLCCWPNTCANRTVMATLDAVVASNPDIRILTGREYGARSAGVWHDGFDFSALLARRVERVTLDFVAIIWPDQHRLQAMDVTDLVEISFNGYPTFPSFSPVEVPWRDDFSRFLALLAISPALRTLSLNQWNRWGLSHRHNMPSVIQLRCLAEISIFDTQVIWVETFFRNVEAPSLRVLSIGAVRFDPEHDHARNIWPQPRSWRFPNLESLTIAIAGPKPNGLGTVVSVLDIASMLEQGDWRNLRTAVFNIAGCIRTDDWRRAIEVLDNPAVAPLLAELWLPEELDCDWVNSVLMDRYDLRWDFVEPFGETTDGEGTEGEESEEE